MPQTDCNMGAKRGSSRGAAAGTRCGARCGNMFLIQAAAMALVASFAASCAPRSATWGGGAAPPEVTCTILPAMRQRTILRDVSELGGLYHPLTEHVGLIRIRNSRDWEQLRRAAPALDAPPALDHGMLVGLVSRSGTPVNGAWPIRIAGVSVDERAGIVAAEVESSCYNPDNAAYLELAYIEGANTIAAIDLGQVRYFP